MAACLNPLLLLPLLLLLLLLLPLRMLGRVRVPPLLAHSPVAVAAAQAWLTWPC